MRNLSGPKGSLSLFVTLNNNYVTLYRISNILAVGILFMPMKTIFEPNYRKLVGWLTAERKFKKITQPELAEKLALPNHTYISKIERFERKLDVYEFVKICSALELDPHEGIDILVKQPVTIRPMK